MSIKYFKIKVSGGNGLSNSLYERVLVQTAADIDMYRSIFYAREYCSITFGFISTLLYDEWTKHINTTICEKWNIRKSVTWKLSIFRYSVLSCNFRHRRHLNKRLLGAELSNTLYFAVALGVDFFHQEHILYERIIWII